MEITTTWPSQFSKKKTHRVWTLDDNHSDVRERGLYSFSCFENLSSLKPILLRLLKSEAYSLVTCAFSFIVSFFTVIHISFHFRVFYL